MLEEFIEANNLEARVIRCHRPVITAKEVSDMQHISLSKVIKTILFIDPADETVLAIVPGDAEASNEKLCSIIGVSSLRTAKPAEAFDITGYEADALPPVSIYGVKTVMDEKLLGKEFVIGGGGDNTRLLRISPKEIEENTEGLVIADITE